MRLFLLNSINEISLPTATVIEWAASAWGEPFEFLNTSPMFEMWHDAQTDRSDCMKPRLAGIHPAIIGVHDAARIIEEHHDQQAEPLWHRLFELPREPHLLDKLRHFVAALDDVLGTSAQELTQEHVEAVGKDINRVVDRIETRIAALSDPKDAMPFAMAIYVMRLRFEGIVARVSHIPKTT
jgi:hypothetical protein